VQLSFPAGASQVEPGTTPAAALTEDLGSMEELRNACGQSRLDGGMHFSAAVPDSYELCLGMGAAAAAYVEALADGVAV